MAELKTLRGEVDVRVRRGEDLATIEDDVIDGCGLPDEDKSALWLYGWATQEAGRGRYERRQQAFRSGGSPPLEWGAE